jgi:PmbA protein
MEEILELARKVSDEAEIYSISSEEAPVHFEANRLKAIESKQSASLSLRIIRKGKLGYAAASGEFDIRKLVDIAVETSEFGMPAKFSFPSERSFPRIEILDPAVEKVGIGEMIELGQKLIEPLIKSTEGLLCEAGVSRDSVKVSILNTRGGRAQYTKTAFGLGVSGTLVRDTDMLFVGDGQESCHPLKDTKAITDIVLHQLELAKNTAVVTTGQMPVIFTPDGLVSAFLPALMSALNGKTVLLGASPLGRRLGEKVFDARFSLFDDPTLDYAPNSRPCDDEGIASRRTPLIENGVVKNFLYDLQTAGQAGAQSTGNGSRGRGGLMSPSPSAWIVGTGQTSFADMVRDVKEGLVIEQLMGAEQGNVMGGDFSGNVLLGYKIENGRITGRVKNTMVSGNVYQLLKEIAAVGKEAKWIGGGICAPALYCSSLSVASK